MAMTGWQRELQNTVHEQAELRVELLAKGRQTEADIALARQVDAELKLCAGPVKTRTVRCDTCGVRQVEVADEYDGTEYVACAVCLGDEEETAPETLVSAREVADDNAIHAAIEDRNEAWGLA